MRTPLIQKPSHPSSSVSSPRKNYWVAIALILLASFSRLIPHPPNFTPVTALALFGGRTFSSPKMAILITFISMFIADIFLGFHAVMPFVYFAFVLNIFMGSLLKGPFHSLKLLGVTLTSSTLFFLITNFGVWLQGGLYPKTIAGLAASYAAALPFYQWTLLGDLFYTAIIFLAYRYFERKNESTVSVQAPATF